MGTKKGKGRQSLGFRSKSARAAYQLEFNERVSEVHFSKRSSSRRKEAGAPKNDSRISCQRSGNNYSECQPYRNNDGQESRRGFVMQGQLRGLLRERLLSDRMEDMQERRRKYSRLMDARRRQNSLKCCEELGSANDEELDVGLENVNAITSLQVLSAMVLGSMFADYLRAITIKDDHSDSNHVNAREGNMHVSELSVEEQIKALHECILSPMTLSNPSIASCMSLNCQIPINVNQNLLARCLGYHQSLQTLNLSFEIDYQRKCKGSKRDSLLFKDMGLLSLVPKKKYDAVGNNVAECWEDIDEKQINSKIFPEIGGCKHLKHLFLTNASGISCNGIVEFMKRCPHIEYLSLNNCLDEENGNDFLRNRKVFSQLMGRSSTVLDLSHCNWLTTDILKQFIALDLIPNIDAHQLFQSATNQFSIIVVGCNYVSLSECEELISSHCLEDFVHISKSVSYRKHTINDVLENMIHSRTNPQMDTEFEKISNHS